jgi:hypothetical protein
MQMGRSVPFKSLPDKIPRKISLHNRVTDIDLLAKEIELESKDTQIWKLRKVDKKIEKK